MSLQAYQDAPSSPWPRQQPPAQQPQSSTLHSSSTAGGAAAAAAAAAPAAAQPAAAPSRSPGSSPQQQRQQQEQVRQRVKAYRGLSAAQFQHPLDSQNTALLRALPGLELLARNMMGPVAEQVGIRAGQGRGASARQGVGCVG